MSVIFGHGAFVCGLWVWGWDLGIFGCGAVLLGLPFRGIAPTVSIVGPATVAPGSTTSYIFRISGGQDKFGGLDVSTTAGSFIAGAGSILQAGQLTHAAGKAAFAGVVEFRFLFEAPQRLGW